jgi:hypothetical protein
MDKGKEASLGSEPLGEKKTDKVMFFLKLASSSRPEFLPSFNYKLPQIFLEFYYDGSGKKGEPFRARFPLVGPKDSGRKKGFDGNNWEGAPRFAQ